jgi:butyryl-CoA dehydrogenase
MTYVAPVKDMLFAMNELAGLSEVNALPGCEDATPETVEAVLEENAKFAGEVVAPLNWEGDKAPSYWQDGQVFTTKGFKEAFKMFAKPAGRACNIHRNSAVRACLSWSRHHA